MGVKRGLLDFCLTVLTCAMVYSQTPVGAIIDKGLGWVFGMERPHRPLTGFFDLGRDDRESEAPTDAELERVVAARREESPEVVDDARTFGVPYDMLRSIELAGGDTGIQLDEDQWSRARALIHRDLPEEPARAANLAAAVLIDYSAVKHGSLDAGLEAFVLGDSSVERAINLARERGVVQPWRLASHQRYLTRAQRERAKPMVNQVMSVHTALTFVWPVSRGRITSRFGPRRDPILGTPRNHNGTDIGLPIGSEVVAAHDGTVKYASYDGVNGHYLKLKHGYGLTTAYCHNSDLQVDKDDAVAQSQVIALSGNSGRSTGPHLHYIVKMGGRPVDPEMFR